MNDAIQKPANPPTDRDLAEKIMNHSLAIGMSSCPHADLEQLITTHLQSERERYQEALRAANEALLSANCHLNQIHFPYTVEATDKALTLIAPLI